MYRLGEYNRLTLNRIVDFGVYLADDEGNEVLMPGKYVSGALGVGDEVEVFVYTDSEDRPVATTEHPYAVVGQFAFMQVSQVNRVGAFMDWGLEAKELLVPYSEQRVKMRRGGIYPVYIYVDHASQRVVGSARLEKFLGNLPAHYRPGAKVDALVIKHLEAGYRVIVDNAYAGMIYDNELYQPLEIGERVKAYVRCVRDDNKVDLRLAPGVVRHRIDAVANNIMETLRLNGGTLDVGDHTSPERIKAMLSCSKKDFKRAVGMLYRQHKILVSEDGLSLAKD